jgi:hypothetical protein
MGKIEQLFRNAGIKGMPNWELMAFKIINKIYMGKGISFYREELMKHIDDALDWLTQYGHKEHPKQPEATLQRTIQNMRDKGWINFIGRGEYKLTEEGEKLIEKLRPIFKILDE